MSPGFMNTRALEEGVTFIPARSKSSEAALQPTAEAVAFDKADDAATVEKIRTAIEQIDSQLTLSGTEAGEPDPHKKLALHQKKMRLAERLKAAEQQMKAQELDD